MIYADNNSTTRCLPEVIEVVSACLGTDFGNPSSKHYTYGRKAAGILDDARATVAESINAQEDEIIFTSGASEALNQAIFGVAERLMQARPAIITSCTEHKAVLEAVERCAQAGSHSQLLSVDRDGIIDFDQLETELKKNNCSLVCVMLANNETGVIQDIKRIADLTHKHGALLLCDITAALGKIQVDIKALDCDFAASSGHKIYAPKGVGFLYKRRGLSISPLIYGGNQEQQLRSGTENIASIAGYSTALKWLKENKQEHMQHLTTLQEQLESQISRTIPDLVINGAGAQRTPGCSSFSIPNLPKGWLSQLKNIAASSGSACSSDTNKASHVLLSMGLDTADAKNSIRISLGHFNTSDEVDIIAQMLIQGQERLRDT